jgi:hypothetical protein
MEMIGFIEAIVQDQLEKSSVAGKVNVNYPRGSRTRLVLMADQDPPLLRTDDSVPPLDNAFSQFTVLDNGNLGHLLDRKNVPGFVIPGANLKALP